MYFSCNIYKINDKTEINGENNNQWACAQYVYTHGKHSNNSRNCSNHVHLFTVNYTLPLSVDSLG